MSERSIESLLDEIKEYKQAIEKIRTEIEELKVICGCQGEDEKEIFDWAVDEALEIIDKHING